MGEEREELTKSSSLSFSFDFMQHQLEWLRSYPEIRAEGPIEDADSEEDQGDGHSEGTNGQEV